jgi:CSLREA domain-containing protein
MMGLYAQLWGRRTNRSAGSGYTATGKVLSKQLRVESLENRLLLAAATVNTTGDTVDANPNVTSLREAIAAVNAETDTSIISTIRFTGAALTSPLQVSAILPVISKPVSIDADPDEIGTRATIVRQGIWTGPALQLGIASGTNVGFYEILALNVNGFDGNAISVRYNRKLWTG